MLSNVKCPNCGHSIELTEAVKKEWEAEFTKKDEQKRKEELARAVKNAEVKAFEKVTQDFNIKLKQSIEEASEEKERNRKLLTDLSENNKLIRELKRKDEERQIETEKKMMEMEEKIKTEAKKQADYENKLKLLEKEKKLAEALKMNEELTRKLNQGSQQTQGEVLELELEKILRSAFPTDEIKPVEKGIRGADIVQKVWDRQGNCCGTILWETKNAKWNSEWIDKLKADLRTVKAEIAILVSEEIPKDIKSAGFRDGVWITERRFIVALATALRAVIIQNYHVKKSVKGKNEKMETIYQYISGVEFKHRIETIVDAFSLLQDELEKEKRFFASKWSRQEKYLRGIIDHTLGIHGDLKGILGSSLPELKGLQLSLE